MDVVSFSFSASQIDQFLENLLESYTGHSRLRNLFVGSALSGLLCAVLTRAEKEGASSIPKAYRHLTRYLEAHYMQKLSLDNLAEQFHISKYHLSREFRKYTCFAPGEYVIMLRISHACILLAQSDLPVEEIAAQSGSRT